MSSHSLGRPHQLTPDVLDELIALFRAGATRDEAALAAGIARRTLFNWITRGEQETAGAFHELAQAAKLSDQYVRDMRRRVGRLARGSGSDSARRGRR